MKGRKISLYTGLLTIGAILMIINNIMIILNGNKPLIVSAFNVSSIADISNPKVLWWRIAFGTPGFVKGIAGFIWLIIPMIILLCIWLSYYKPRRYKALGLIIVTFSLLSLLTGGGFIIGAIFAFLGGSMIFEQKKSFEESFFGRIIKAALGDSNTILKFLNNKKLLNIAFSYLLFTAIVGGIGSCVYAHNVSLINATYIEEENIFAMGPAAEDILLKGTLYFSPVIGLSVLSLIVFIVIKWVLLSTIVYIVGVKYAQKQLSFDKIAGAMSLVYIPDCIQILQIFLLPNEPLLSKGLLISFLPFVSFPISWPLIFFFIAEIWSFIILVRILEVTLEIFRGKAFGMSLFISAVYFVAVYLFLTPMLNVPGVQIGFPKESLIGVEMLLSIMIIIGVIFGAFERE